MSILAKLNTDGLESSNDFIGGWSPLVSDSYEATLLGIALFQIGSGACFAAVRVKVHTPSGERAFAEDILVTNKNGENFSVRDGKRVLLPGAALLENISLLAAGKPISKLTEGPSTKVKDARNRDQDGHNLSGGFENKKVRLLIQHVSEEGNDGKFYDKNSISNVLHAERRSTVNELRAISKDPSFKPSFEKDWLDSNRGKVYTKKANNKSNSSTLFKPSTAPVENDLFGSPETPAVSTTSVDNDEIPW
jgi:hypothetical protein